jgi:hypothetical protein
MLVGALRKTYGPNFAKGCADNERLSEVLAKDVREFLIHKKPLAVCL